MHTVEPHDINDYAVKVCSVAGCSHTSINIVLIGDTKMTDLNETYSLSGNILPDKNKRSGTTDVLSFDLSEVSSELLEGEVYVSLDRAKIQAEEYGIPFEIEIVRLVTHGLLHLAGRTHDTPESYRAMVDETENLIAIYWERSDCD
ncbi:rRNA maturation RNase YbeY [Candidatus Latescibacterota bacterium]